MVFLKDSIFHLIEGKRNKLFAESATVIQSWYRGITQRKHYEKQKYSAKILVTYLQEYLLAADPTSRVKELMEQIQTDSNPESLVGAINELERLALRDKNVDIICTLSAQV